MKVWICVAAAILALGITLYPLVSNYLAEHYRSVVESRYTNAVESLDNGQLTAAKDAARAYNATLVAVTDKPYSKEALSKASESYESLLNIQADGIMGYVEIPKIGVDLPIYHGTGEDALEQGAGHLLGSSLPVGGKGSHCVITGHSGLAGQKMFSDLEQLQEGDVFYLHVLNETMAYMVSEIHTVLPEDTSKLTVDPDRDSVTLVTCTPYGVNTHRLLVRGDRTASVPAAEQTAPHTLQDADAVASAWTEEYIQGVCYGLLGITAVILIAGIIRTESKLRRLKAKSPWDRKAGRHTGV